MKDIQIQCRLQSENNSEILLAENLRPVGGGGLKIVGKGRSYAALGGWRPLARMADGSGRYIFCKGATLGIGKLADAAPVTAGELDAEPTAILRRGDRWLVTTPLGQWTVREENGGLGISRHKNHYGAVSLRVQTCGRVSHTVGERKLSREYQPGEMPSAAEIKALTSDYADAYVSAATEAAAAGAFVQPVLARCKYYGHDGELLYISAPVLLTPPEGGQACGFHTLYSTDGRTVRPYTLELSSYTILAEAEADSTGTVSRVEVCISPQFHPYGCGSGEFVRDRSGEGNRFGRVALPGRQCGISTLHTAASSARIMNAIAHMDALLLPAAQLQPSATDKVSTTVSNPAGDIAAEAAGLKKILGSAAKTSGQHESLLGLPHTFGAALHAGDSHSGAWGNLHICRFDGYNIGESTATVEPRRYTGSVQVYFKGRKGVVRYFEGEGKPQSFHPILAYPSGDATRMRISISADGFTYGATYPLTRSACGRYSVYVAPDFLPFEPPEAPSAQIVDIESADEDFADAYALYSDNEIKNIGRTGSTILALSELSNGDGAWEFGRRRYIAATATAVYSLAAGQGGTASLRPLLRRGVSGAECLAQSTEGVYAAAADGLYLIKGTGRSVRRVGRTVYQRLLWIGNYRELLASTATATHCICPDFGHDYYRRSDYSGRFIVCEGTPYIINATALTLPGSETAAETNATLRLRHFAGGNRELSVRSMLIDIRGGCILTAELNTAEGPMAQLNFSGNARRPVECRFRCRPSREFDMYLTLRGKNTEIHSISLTDKPLSR